MKMRFKKNGVKKKVQVKGHRADGWLLAAVFTLLIFGVVMMASLGVSKSIQLTAPGVLYPNCDDVGVDCYKLFKDHLVRVGVGLLFMLIVSKIPTGFWKKIAPVLYYGSIITLILVLILGMQFGTFAKSWLKFFETSLQPIEFAKIGLVLYLASWFSSRKSDIKDLQKGFLPFLILTGFIIVPVVMQPDLGGAMVIGTIALIMVFMAGAKLRHILATLLIVAFSGFLLISWGAKVSDKLQHLEKRFGSFLIEDKRTCKHNDCWQAWQSEIAIGSGGLWGKGLTQGVQKSEWLPQTTDDFIFAASAEELGFFRVSLILILYSFIAFRGFKIAHGAPDKFSEFTAMGISVWISFQAFINIGVNVGLVPITGITLPFVSYGGSSMVAMLVATGILLHISKHSNYALGIYWRRDRRPYNAKLGND